MKALITGASSGIGLEIAKVLAKKDVELILVSKDKDKLQKAQNEIGGNTKIIVADLSNENKLKELYVLCKNEKIDILVNNAGFGDCGKFYETDLSKDLQMIDVNIKAVHVLTKLFLKDMKKRNSGYILNVASIAAYTVGPLMATYYATKSYVLKLSAAINEELCRDKSNVSISCLCPGPVDTNFNKVANVKFSINQMSSKDVAKYAVDGMFAKKLVIVPGFKMKLARFFSGFLPMKFIAKISYNFQRKKIY